MNKELADFLTGMDSSLSTVEATEKNTREKKLKYINKSAKYTIQVFQ